MSTLRSAAAWRGDAELRLGARMGEAMKAVAKKRWVRVAEVALAVVIVGLLVATVLPAIIGANPSAGR